MDAESLLTGKGKSAEQLSVRATEGDAVHSNKLQDYRIPEKSYDKGVGQSYTELPYPEPDLKITKLPFIKPVPRAIEKSGVSPNFESTYGDTELQRAIDLLNSRDYRRE